MSNKQEIYYSDILALGFKEQICDDSIYEKMHGFKYCIITKKLTNKIYLDWSKETKKCKMVRIDSEKNWKH